MTEPSKEEEQQPSPPNIAHLRVVLPEDPSSPASAPYWSPLCPLSYPPPVSMLLPPAPPVPPPLLLSPLAQEDVHRQAARLYYKAHQYDAAAAEEFHQQVIGDLTTIRILEVENAELSAQLDLAQHLLMTRPPSAMTAVGDLVMESPVAVARGYLSCVLRTAKEADGYWGSALLPSQAADAMPFHVFADKYAHQQEAAEAHRAYVERSFAAGNTDWEWKYLADPPRAAVPQRMVVSSAAAVAPKSRSDKIVDAWQDLERLLEEFPPDADALLETRLFE